VGVRRNDRLAVQWYRRAARQGDLKAQFNLALCYLYGDGVRRALPRAKLWLRRAATRRHSRAAELLRLELKHSPRSH
jgi:TPR repeat protein